MHFSVPLSLTQTVLHIHLTTWIIDEPAQIEETLIDDDEAHEPAEDLKPAPNAEEPRHVSSEMYHYLYFDDNDSFFAVRNNGRWEESRRLRVLADTLLLNVPNRFIVIRRLASDCSPTL